LHTSKPAFCSWCRIRIPNTDPEDPNQCGTGSGSETIVKIRVGLYIFTSVLILDIPAIFVRGLPKYHILGKKRYFHEKGVEITAFDCIQNYLILDF
jgi:hypothetical protein